LTQSKYVACVTNAAAKLVDEGPLPPRLLGLVVKATGDLAPLTQNLVVLAEKTGLEFQESVRVYFVEMNRFALHGRYPDPDRPLPSGDYS